MPLMNTGSIVDYIGDGFTSSLDPHPARREEAGAWIWLTLPDYFVSFKMPADIEAKFKYLIQFNLTLSTEISDKFVKFFFK